MHFNSFPSPLFKALFLLEAYETQQARGIFASRFYVLHAVNEALHMAVEAGDCVAPFFQHYMVDQGYYDTDGEPLIDLETVPNHRSQGDIWVKAYQLYVHIWNEFKHFTPTTSLHLKSGSTSSTELHWAYEKKKHDRDMLAFIQKMTELIELQHPTAYVFCGKLIERYYPSQLEIIYALYNASAFYPNVWGVYEYVRWMSQHPGFKASIESREPLKYATVISYFNLLSQADGCWTNLMEYFRDHERFSSQWLIHANIHGTSQPSQWLILAFNYAMHNMTSRPITRSETSLEAEKWVQWIIKRHNSERFFMSHMKNFIQLLESNLETNSLGFRILILKTLSWIFDENSNDETKIPREDCEDYFLQMIQTDQIRHYCYFIHQQKPQHPLLTSHHFYANELGLYFESERLYEQAECCYRRAGSLAPHFHEYHFNLANCLRVQAKNHDESIHYYFEAAKLGCQDSFKVLLYHIFVLNRLSSKQILEFKHIAATTTFSWIETLNFSADEFQIFGLHSWLLIAHDQQLNQHEFSRWKTTLAQDARGIAQEKIGFFKQYREQFSRLSLVDEPEKIEEEQAPEDTEDTEDLRRLDVRSDLKTDQHLRECSPSASERALQGLQKLSEKPRKNLTQHDYVKMHEYFSIILNKPMSFSTKGRTSGSRVAITGHTIHLTHGRDRMSPKAQQRVQRALVHTLQEAQSKCNLTKS